MGADGALIDFFLERAWSELGLADNTLAGYRRDLEGYSRWLTAQGVQREVVIGHQREGGGFKAHAWLEGEMLPPESHYVEIVRLAP